MKRGFIAVLLAITTLAILGCGSGGSSTPTFVSQIFSDPVQDGDITRSATNPPIYTFAQGNTQSLFAGIDPVTLAETRAFLDFPLTGTGGVPPDAIIASATIDLFIDSFQSTAGTVPMRAELVSFGNLQPLSPSVSLDFDSSPLTATVIRFPVFQSDVNGHVVVDVTPLMDEAQRLGLANFQVRIMEDLGIVTPGLIEINDTTGPNSGALAPLLEVTYF